MALLEAAVVADRLRGASWSAVAEALDVSAEAAQERFGSAERRFREALLFPHRYPENGGLGYTAAPYAVEEPDRVRERLDAWVVEHRRSSGPDRDESEPVTRGLAAMAGTWIAERIGQVLELSDALIKRELPDGVSYKDAELRQAQLKVELYEAMAAERPGSREVEQQLAGARKRLAGAARAHRGGSRLSHVGLAVRSRTGTGCALRLEPVSVASEVKRPDLRLRLADQVALMGTFP